MIDSEKLNMRYSHLQQELYMWSMRQIPTLNGAVLVDSRISKV